MGLLQPNSSLPRKVTCSQVGGTRTWTALRGPLVYLPHPLPVIFFIQLAWYPSLQILFVWTFLESNLYSGVLRFYVWNACEVTACSRIFWVRYRMSDPVLYVNLSHFPYMEAMHIVNIAWVEPELFPWLWLPPPEKGL